MDIGLYVKYLLFCQTLKKLEFSVQIIEKYSNIYLLKVHPVGADLFRVDGRTEEQI
jgi:hypothetical protein